MAGSGNWGTIIADKDGHYDLDYQIILTHNSKVYKEAGSFKNPTKIKSDFLNAFNSFRTKGESFQDPTTAITLVNKDGEQPYTIDFVIIDGTPFSDNLPTCSQIIKRNISKEDSSKDLKTWNKLTKVSRAYGYFKTLNPYEKRDVI